MRKRVGAPACTGFDPLGEGQTDPSIGIGGLEGEQCCFLFSWRLGLNI